MKQVGRKWKAIRWNKPLSTAQLEWLLKRGFYPILCRPTVSK